jgi:oligopeptide/dipeptide ABC transporter ATP-binding protein
VRRRDGATLTGIAAEEPTAGAVGSRLLEVDGLRVSFARAGALVRAVTGVSFSVDRGKTLGIVGESGSGKSVTARAIMGLLPSETSRVAGSVRLGGEQLIGLSDRQWRAYRGRDVAMVFQDPARSLNPTIRVGDQVAEGLRAHRGMGRAEARSEAIELLGLVQMPDPRRRYDEYPHQLSGGMRQRVMIAAAIACRPKLLIADEATTALDVTTQAQVMDLLVGLQEQFEMGLILISHDIGLAATYTDEVAVMYAGRVVERAATSVLLRQVRMPYTRGLLDSIPRMGQEPHEPLSALPGRPPDPRALPSGCPFQPRCAHAASRCEVEPPFLEEHEPGHHWACWYPL